MHTLRQLESGGGTQVRTIANQEVNKTPQKTSRDDGYKGTAEDSMNTERQERKQGTKQTRKKTRK